MRHKEFNSELFQEKYRIKSIRLPNWDYSSNGHYFITICTKNMVESLGEIKNGIMGLNELGCIAHRFWNDISNHFNNVRLGEFVIMPNHVHGVVRIQNNHLSVDTRHGAYLRLGKNNTFGPLNPNSLSSIINHYKGSVKRWCNQNRYSNFQWQSRYYDHIIRNEKSQYKIEQYICNNPQKWCRDRNNSKGL